LGILLGLVVCPDMQASLSSEVSALRAAVWRQAGAGPLLPSPTLNNWRRWAGTSWLVKDQSSYFAVRCLLATIMVSVLLGYWISFGVHHPLHFWFIYLTNWTLSVQVSYLCLACWTSWAARPSGEEAAPSGKLRALIALQAVATPGAVLVTLLFWTLVFPTWRESAHYLVNYLVHGVNCAVALTDLLLTRQPFPLAHSAVLLPMYCTTYIAFSIIHYLSGSTNEWGQPWIYRPIYWGAPDAWKGAFLCICLLAFFLPALVLAVWACAWRRDAWDSARGGDTEDIETLLYRLQRVQTAADEGTAPLLASESEAAPAEEEELPLSSSDGAEMHLTPRLSTRMSNVAL
jgi:hypothetical protein